MCKNLKLIALVIDESFTALFTLKYKFRTNKRQGVVWLSFNIVNLSPSGQEIFHPRAGFALYFPVLNFIALQQVEPLKICLVKQ